MAEYYAVLSKAVGSLEANSADARRAVYDKARNALIGQLKAIDPPLPTSEISRQRLELEEAIRRVERETSALPAGAPVRVAPAKRTPPAERADRPPPANPKDVFRRAIQQAEAEAGADNQPAAPPVPAATSRRERAPAAVRAEDWSSDRMDVPAAPPPAKPTPQYLPSQGYVEEKSGPSDEPRLAPDYEYEWEQGQAPSPVASSTSKLPPPRETEPYIEGRDRSGRVKGEKRGRTARQSELDDVLEQGAPRPSRLPIIILLVLIAIMVVGLGAFAYSERDLLADLFGGFDSNSKPAATAAAPAPPPQPVDTSGKATDRLLPPGSDTSAAAPDAGSAAPADDTATADNTVRTVTPGPNDAANAPAPAVPAPAPTDQTAAAPAAPAPAATAPAEDDSLVAQPATLYEQPTDPSQQANGMLAIQAAATWSFVPSPDGGTIAASIDVPQRGLKLNLTIAKNTDQTLPVSHIIQMKFTVPANFPGKSIADVPRLVAKPATDARGTPLIGAPAKGTQGFVFVLSNDPADLNANLSLLKQEWFDLYVVYGTGQRAVISFEKGTPGQRVFDKAFAAWGVSG
ncbi:MAG TPA: hypothetical protein VG894_09370 [Bauldia sp.]|nr:hypothetical protein [Bauldia sp.]